MSPLAITIILAMVLAAGAFLLFTVVNNISVCPPSEVLIFSGRTRRLADGRSVGYRVVRGGRAMRIPLIETIDRMQLTNMAIELSVTNAFSRGGRVIDQTHDAPPVTVCRQGSSSGISRSTSRLINTNARAEIITTACKTAIS